MMATCPSEDALLAGLTPELEEHIDGCAECRAVMSAGARGDVPPRFGRYRLDTVLGAGGMGIVYRAWDPELARAVAIKVLQRAGDDRLVTEARSLARVTHANVCRVYDVGSDGEQLWVAMELVDGTTLREHAGDPWPVLFGAAEGLAAAHDAGVVHRDVKPENVLVARDGHAVVTDFGLARSDEANASTVASEGSVPVIAGTPAYLAPEQLTGAAVDARCDQFAWAVMAWELATGARPFPSVLSARLDAIRAGVTAPASMSPRLAAVLQRAMSVAPRDRFASMRELAVAVRTAQVPLRAPPGRKSKVVPIAVGLVVLGCGAVLAGVSMSGTGEKAVAVSSPPIPESSPSPSPSPSPISVSPPPPSPAPPPPKTIPTVPPKSRSGSGSGSGSGSTRAVVPPKTAPELTDDEVLDAVDPPLSRAAALAYLDDGCHIPMDPAHPDPALGKFAVADWGTVISVEKKTAHLVDRATTFRVIELKGARATYHFRDDQRGRIVAKPGDLFLICPDDTDDPWKIDGVTTWRIESALKLSRAPRVDAIAALDPIHVHSLSNKLDPSRRYLLHRQITAVDGDTVTLIDKTTLQLQAGLAVTANTAPWIVVEDKSTIVAVVDDLLP